MKMTVRGEICLFLNPMETGTDISLVNLEGRLDRIRDQWKREI
jgi:hypothetical protein